MPLLAHWATEDAAFPIAKVDELEKMLRAANVKFEFHRYNAKHAFANETADSKNLPILKYDPKAAEMAWGTVRSNVLGPGFPADEFLTARLSLDPATSETDRKSVV